MTYSEDDLLVDGIKIHYYRTGGDKPPLIMLHGAGDSGLCWSPAAKRLADRYDVIMPDAQGHGQSDRLTPDFKPFDFAVQIAALVHRLELANPLFMGHSMGADVVVDLALHYPEIPTGIVLEDPLWLPFITPGQETPDQLKRQQKLTQAITRFSQKSQEELLEEGHRSYPRWSDEDIRLWAEAKKQFDIEIFDRRPVNRITYLDFAARTNCPTLLITSQWGLVSREIAQLVQRSWVSQHTFKWVQISQAGHNIRRDQFERFIKAVEEFVATL